MGHEKNNQLLDALTRHRQLRRTTCVSLYSSFLLFAQRAEKRYGISAREILLELGRRKMVGGQEDMIEDAALTMAKERKLQSA